MRRTALFLMVWPALLHAQSAAGLLDLGGSLLANGEALRYLRSLSLTDSVPAGGLTLQPFGRAGDARWMAYAARGEHPWRERFSDANARGGRVAGVQWALLRPDAQLYLRSSNPAQEAEGVVWAGRGATAAVQAGVRTEWKFLRAQFAPVAFIAQNSDFELTRNGLTGARTYRDPRFPNNIDRPQRFGKASYARVDFGDSYIEASAFGLVGGLSTARQHWGPAREYPLVMGTGSGGFQHFHISTAAPWGTPAGELQFRLLVGQLQQSEFSPIQVGELERFLSAFVGSYRPRFLPALEIGATRVINGPWPEDGIGLGLFLRPFEGIINDNEGPINENRDNGFASVFLRLAPRGSGLEAYAEMSREDFAGSLRWLALEPDDLVHYTLGVSKARREAEELRVWRMELVNGEVAHTERAARTLTRPIAPYTHGQTRQGLTNRGQLLGSAAAFGGAGGSIAWERYSAAGRVTIAAERETVLDWLPARGYTGGVPHAEVRYGMRYERMQFRGAREWTLMLAPRYTLNRRLEQGEDEFSLEMQLRWRGW